MRRRARLYHEPVHTSMRCPRDLCTWAIDDYRAFPITTPNAPLIRGIGFLQLHKPNNLRVYVEALSGELSVGCLRRMVDLLLQEKNLPLVCNKASQPQPDQNNQREVGLAGCSLRR